VCVCVCVASPIGHIATFVIVTGTSIGHPVDDRGCKGCETCVDSSNKAVKGNETCGCGSFALADLDTREFTSIEQTLFHVQYRRAGKPRARVPPLSARLAWCRSCQLGTIAVLCAVQP